MNKYLLPLVLLIVITTPVLAETTFNLKAITIYPQNVALLNKDADLIGANEYSATLESNAFIKSIRLTEDDTSITDLVINPKVAKTTAAPTAWSLKDLFTKNKQIRIILNGEDIEGTVISTHNDLLFLNNARYKKTGEIIPFLSVKISEIDNILLTETPTLPSEETIPLTSITNYYPQTTPEYILSWKDTSTKPRTAHLSYLASGYSWEPVYYLDTTEQQVGLFTKQTAKFSYSAKITTPENITDATMRLVAGQIRISMPGSARRSTDYLLYDSNTQAELDFSYGNGALPSVSSLAEYEVYELNKVSMQAKETKLTPIFDGKVQFDKLYVYDARTSSSQWRNYNSWEEESNGKVQRIYTISNDGKTWANGVVSVYQDGILIGEDAIEWTPKGKQAKVTIGLARDIETNKKDTVKKFFNDDKNHKDWDYTHTITLSMKNFKKEKITLKILDSLPSDSTGFTCDSDYQEKPGNILEWNIDLDPGQERKIQCQFVSE